MWETRIPSQSQILHEFVYTISTPWGAMPSNRWQPMSYEAQNKDDGRDFLFSEISVSLIHDITDFPPLREGVLPEALSFLPSAGALSLKAWDQIKEDVSPIPADTCFPPKKEL